MIAVIDAQLAWWPPTFSPSRLGADVVGVVDRPGAQPAQPFLDEAQGIEVGGALLQHGGAVAGSGSGRQGQTILPGTERGPHEVRWRGLSATLHLPSTTLRVVPLPCEGRED